MLQFHYKQVQYWLTDRITKVHENKVVMDKGNWDMVKDYILFLESELHQTNGSIFSDIKTEMIKRLGEEKVGRYYGKRGRKND